MEAFSFLKYWRANGGDTAADVIPLSRSSAETAVVVDAVAQNPVENDEDDSDGDEGPFFDLEFSVPSEDDPAVADLVRSEGIDGGQDCNINESDGEDEEEEDSEGEREFNFTLSDSSNDRTDTNLSLSPSDDLYFKGQLVPIETSSIAINGSEQNSKPQLKVSLLKSATKFRVFMLGFKKSNNAEEKADSDESTFSAGKHPQETPQNQPEKQAQPPHGRFFTVKFKVEEVPIVSLFTRDNSSRSNSANKPAAQKHNSDEETSDEKKFSKDVMNKYLKMVKPLYIRVSRKYGEKLKLAGHLRFDSGAKTAGSPLLEVTQKSSPGKSTVEKNQTTPEASEAPPPATATDNSLKSQKLANVPAGLKVVRKHLGKSKSASLAVAPAAAAPTPSRRDDSLLLQQDGIRSAILHCKRSFNASRVSSDSPSLSRSVSDPLNEKSPDEEKENESDDDL